MTFLNHNDGRGGPRMTWTRLIVSVVRDAEKWRLHKNSKPAGAARYVQFLFWTVTITLGKFWPIPGGYSWMFERGRSGRPGHMSRNSSGGVDQAPDKNRGIIPR